MPITYQYTGNPFTIVSGPYTTSMFVTAMVTLAGPLAPNMPLTQVFPTAFTFSDGVQTITNFNATGSIFSFETGSTGAITKWFVDATAPGDNGITTRNSATTPFDRGSYIRDVGLVRESAGQWTVMGQVPDTGSTLSLMTLTLMALGLMARRFQRRAV